MMKKVTLLVLALLFVSCSVSAQWISLYKDYERSASSVQGVGVGEIVQVYLFVCPRPYGIRCIELNSYTTGDGVYVVDELEYYPEVAHPVTGGFPNSDLMGCWHDCHYDWVYLCVATLLVQSDDPFCINIRGYQGQALPRVEECTDDWVDYIPWCHFCLNQFSNCEVAVEESSWGVIKRLYE